MGNKKNLKIFETKFQLVSHAANILYVIKLRKIVRSLNIKRKIVLKETHKIKLVRRQIARLKTLANESKDSK